MDLSTLLEATLNGLGYELVDLDLPGRSGLLRVFIDKPEASGGVTIDDCERVSNQISRLLEVEGFDYDRLEVSSPGLDRPLKKAADFQRFAGARVRLRLRVPVAGRRNFLGELAGCDEGKIRLVLLPDDAGGDAFEPGAILELDLNDLEKARLAPDFGPQKKTGPNQRPGKPSKKPAKRR